MPISPSVEAISFGAYLLEPRNARLLCNGRPVALTPKALQVLQFLASRPDQLVKKEELLAEIWPDVIVTDASVKVCVREIRRALDDEARAPTYVETVHRLGYRFIAPVREESVGIRPAAQLAQPAPAAEASWPQARLPFVGRDDELAQLHKSLNSARSGQRQCVMLSGGPGSGKPRWWNRLPER